MELVLSWYKTWHCVGLVIQSLLLPTTQQPSNKPFTSLLNMPMINSRTFQSSSGLNTITRPTPKRSGGNYPLGQQVVVTNLVSFWWKTDLLWLRYMTWFSLIFLWLRSSRLLRWTTISGCRPSSTTRSWRGLGEWSQPIPTNDSCGESLGWEWLIQRLEKRLWTLPLGPWGTPQP